MLNINGKYCPVPGPGQLVAVTCGGNLTAVPANFPGSRRAGPLFPTPEAAEEFRRELWARACERLAAECGRADRTTGRCLTAELCLSAAEACRRGECPREVLRFAGHPEWEWRAYEMVLPEGAVDG